jgi:NAD(P)-dependent dehydrogenase (short-subunit alcohol dehydrogenase family)
VGLGLEGKTVVVAGDGSNVGRGTVLGSAREVANMLTAEADEVQGEKMAGEANALGGKALATSISPDAVGSVSLERRFFLGAKLA